MLIGLDVVAKNFDEKYCELGSADETGTPDPEACGKIWPLLYDFADTCAGEQAESLIWETCIRFSQYGNSSGKDDRFKGCNGRIADLLYSVVLICKEELLCRMGKLDRDKRTFTR